MTATLVRPPRLASALLRGAVGPGLVSETILGDLWQEYGQRRAMSRRPLAALWYWREVGAVGLAVLRNRLRGDSPNEVRPLPRTTPSGASRPGRGGSSPRKTTIASRLLVTLGQELVHAFRNLRRSPAFSLVAIVSLGLGLGATTTVFTVLNTMLLRPPPLVVEPDRLVAIYTSDYSGATYSVSSYPSYEDIRDRVESLTGTAAFTAGDELHLETENTRRVIFGAPITHDYFDVLGVPPALGRSFTREEATPGSGAQVIILSYATWEGVFGADPDILGQTVRVNGREHVIVGVAADGLMLPGYPVAPQAYMPTAHERMANRGSSGLSIIARLRPGARLEQTQQQLDALALQLADDYPEIFRNARDEPRRFNAVPEAQARGGVEQRAVLAAFLIGIMAVVLLVLAIACSNLASLLLARASRRAGEISVRAALGAGRARLLAMLVSETLLLTLAAGAFGMLLNVWLVGALLNGNLIAFPEPAPEIDLAIDVRVTLFAFAVSLLTGLLFGLLPARAASKPDLVGALKGTAGTQAGWRRFGLRSTLVVAQIAASVVLVVGAGLFLRSLGEATRLDLGYEPAGIALMRIDVAQQEYGEVEGRQLLDDLRRRLEAQPGVQSTAIAWLVPMGGRHVRYGLDEIEDYTMAPGEETLTATNVVTPGYFELMRMPLIAGRDFRASDDAPAPRVVIVNEESARRYWPGETAIGKHLTFMDAEHEVVGVAVTAKYRNIAEEPQPHLWLPFAQDYQGHVTLHVRTDGPVAPLLPLMREQLAELDSVLVAMDLVPMTTTTATATTPQRVALSVLGAAGALALTLAIVGIYGVVGFAATQRTHEVGIRVALGAGRRNVVMLILREGLLLALVGVGLGLGLAAAASTAIGSLLVGITPLDPVTLIGAASLLGLAAVAASLGPALRASRVDPAIALRAS